MDSKCIGSKFSIVHWGKYYPPEMGGIEVVTRDLAAAQAEAGHRVGVVCFTRGGSGVSVQGLLSIHRCREWLSKASQPLSWSYIHTGLRLARHAEVVHVHAPNPLASLMCLGLGSKSRLVIHWHSDIVGKGWLGKLVRPLERLMLKRADAVLCTSEAYAEHSEPLRPWLSKVHCVPIGIPDPQVTPISAHLPEGFSSFLKGRRLIFSAGRLVPYKGFRHLIDAIAHLPPDVALAIAGQGPLREDLEFQVKRLGLGDRVRLVGRVSDEELQGLFSAAQVFCLASVERSEAFGVVLLEAMARGLPVIATRIEGSGVPWVNSEGESGLNVPPSDPRALAEACMALLGDAGLHARLSSGARLRYLKQFRATTSAQRVLKIYGTLGER